MQGHKIYAGDENDKHGTDRKQSRTDNNRETHNKEYDSEENLEW